jgi:hypothetical protein
VETPSAAIYVTGMLSVRHKFAGRTGKKKRSFSEPRSDNESDFTAHAIILNVAQVLIFKSTRYSVS